jgi:hypothetical protein
VKNSRISAAAWNRTTLFFWRTASVAIQIGMSLSCPYGSPKSG